MILVLEDNADDFFFLERALGRAAVDMPVVRMQNGAEAEAYLAGAAASPDPVNSLPLVIIADLKMPGVGGLDFIRWLRRESQHKSMPVIVISSSTIASDVATAYSLGANWFIEKPNDPAGYDAIARSLRQWLQIIKLPARN
jgi:CheY-like chemotaxis protein